MPPAAQLERFVLVPRREWAALSVLGGINGEEEAQDRWLFLLSAQETSEGPHEGP